MEALVVSAVQTLQPIARLTLLGISAVGMSVILERALCFASTLANPERLRRELGHELHVGERLRARRALEEQPGTEARVLAAGLQASSRQEARDRMLGEARLQKLVLERGLSELMALAWLAPSLGLMAGVSAHNEQPESLAAWVALSVLVCGVFLASAMVLRRLARVRLVRAEALGRDVLADFAEREAR